LSSAVAFLVGWIAFNPYVLVSTNEFWRDLQFERIHVGFGHYVAEPRNPLLWFSIWFQETRVAGAWLMVVGLTLASWHLVRTNLESGRVDSTGDGSAAANSAASSSMADRSVANNALADSGVVSSSVASNSMAGSFRGLTPTTRRFLWVVAGYVATSVLYLGAAVVMRRMRYSLHFWPLLFVLVGFGLDRGLEMLRRRNRALAESAWSIAVACGLVLGISTVLSRGPESAGVQDPIFAAAEWMAERYDPSTPIVADAYFYRHPHFKNLHVVPGVKPDNLIEHEAFVVVLLERTSGSWSWKEPGTRFEEHRFRIGGRADAEAVQQFHRELTAPTSPYRVVYETDSVVILELKEDVFESETPPTRTPQD
jgi:hypothetical protein